MLIFYKVKLIIYIYNSKNIYDKDKRSIQMKFKYDLHVHTKEVSACARLSMEEIIDEYIKEGYAGLIITDHFRKGYFRKCKYEKEYEKKIKDFFYSYDKGIKYSKDKDFYIGLGVEIKKTAFKFKGSIFYI